MTPPRPEMACATCLTPLNTLGDTYIHPIGIRAIHRHPPVPVPVTDLDTVRRTCDFCSDPYPLWTLTGGDVAAVITSGTSGLLQNFGDRWAACAPCHQHITDHRHDLLTQRALRALPALDATAQHKLAELHDSFLAGLQPGRTLITTTAWPPASTITAHALADRLEQAHLYWVDPTFTDLTATAAQSLPTTTVTADLIPGTAGILAWATPIGDTAAITWTMHDTTIHLVRYRTIGNGLDQHALQTVREDVGWLAPIAAHSFAEGGTVNPKASAGVAVPLATWLLMSQPAADTSTVDIDKPTRRRYARQDRPLPDVRLVHLRAGHRTPTGAPRAESQLERAAPAQRVWVTGHWRNQPHGPGRTLRRPVYIHPFLRGPDNAPIKLSTTIRLLSETGKITRPPNAP
jgi:hypothetical protein